MNSHLDKLNIHNIQIYFKKYIHPDFFVLIFDRTDLFFINLRHIQKDSRRKTISSTFYKTKNFTFDWLAQTHFFKGELMMLIMIGPLLN